MQTNAPVSEITLILRGILGAIIAGALIGVLHYFGIPVPTALTLPVMAAGGYGLVKHAVLNA